MSTTLKEIAEKSGVSIATASRVVNGGANSLTREKKEKILRVATELGYFQKRSNGISPRKTLHVWRIYASADESLDYPFFGDISEGFRSHFDAIANRYDIVLTTHLLNDSSFASNLDNPPDGAIVLGRTTQDNIKLLNDHIPHLVYVGVNPMYGMDEVVSEGKDGIKALVSYLAGLGHKHIGFIGPSKGQSEVYNEFFYQGFCEGMQEQGLEIRPEWVKNCHVLPEEGYAAAKALLASPHLPDAIVCRNDNVAIGVIRALDEKGIRVPADISVTGYDDIKQSAYLKPSLTTVSSPRKDMGRIAAQTLIDAIEHPRDYAITIRFPFKLIERESSSPLR